MAQVSIGQVENLEELLQGLLSVRDQLESACREQINAAESKLCAAREEAETSGQMLELAAQHEQAAQQAVNAAQSNLQSCLAALSSAVSALSSCQAQPPDENGNPPDCSDEESAVASAEADTEAAQAELEQAQVHFEQAKENRQAMERRVEYSKQACAMAEQAMEQARAECSARLASVSQSLETATRRLFAAQEALNAYLATNPAMKQFHSWLKWDVTQHGSAITPNTLRDRMNLSAEQRALLQEYLYDRNPQYRDLVDRYRGEWAAAKGDAERNIVARKTRTHISGAFAEHMTRLALAPLGGKIETQGRTFVGDSGRYTKTDLIVTDLRVPVILGRGDGMAAPVGGSMAFEVKCGKADYLYSEKGHMVFQAEGHKQADAQCTLCSRDIHDLPPEKEKQLRETLHEAGSPLVGMLPRKNEIDESCIDFIRSGEEVLL
jgi:chemotaxis protein histidine kinase CheA